MAKVMTWFILHLKMFIKKPVNIALLVLLPLCALFLKPSAADTSDSFTVGVYQEGSDSVASELAERLNNYSGNFSFEIMDNPDELYRMVLNNTLIGGIILPSDLTKRTIDGNCEDSILSIAQPGSTVQGAVNEVVYAELIAIQGRYLIADYVDKSLVFHNTDTDYADELLGYYEKYLENGSTFSLEFKTFQVDGLTDIATDDLSVKFPVRGIIALIVYLAAMIGVFDFMRQRESGALAAFSVRSKMFSRVLFSLIPALCMGIVALVSLGISGDFVGIIEIPAMLLLIVLSIIWALLCSFLCKKSIYLLPVIFVVLLGAAVFCPVFINIGMYFPGARFVEKIFVPYYYLRIFM